MNVQEVLDAENARTVFSWYKKRWEVENFFRAIKQEFGAEDSLIRSFLPFKLSLSFRSLSSVSCFNSKKHLSELMGALGIWFSEFCHRWQRAKESHIDLVHWIREALHICVPNGSHRFWSLELSVHRYQKAEKSTLDVFTARKNGETPGMIPCGDIFFEYDCRIRAAVLDDVSGVKDCSIGVYGLTEAGILDRAARASASAVPAICDLGLYYAF